MRVFTKITTTILALIFSASAYAESCKITVTATANGKTVIKSFVSNDDLVACAGNESFFSTYATETCHATQSTSKNNCYSGSDDLKFKCTVSATAESDTRKYTVSKTTSDYKCDLGGNFFFGKNKIAKIIDKNPTMRGPASVKNSTRAKSVASRSGR